METKTFIESTFILIGIPTLFVFAINTMIIFQIGHYQMKYIKDARKITGHFILILIAYFLLFSSSSVLTAVLLKKAEISVVSAFLVPAILAIAATYINIRCTRSHERKLSEDMKNASFQEEN